ncbi:mechanosensitive ion channel family protein [Flavitalea sp.]|nr:mechanosensitive ion channel family protein [Flavitalea sp.]
MDSYLDKVYWGNTVQSYFIALAGIFVSWVIIRILRGFVMTHVTRWISKSNSTYDDVILSEIRKYILPYAYLFINYQIINQLNLSHRLQKILTVAMAVITIYFLVRVINHAIQLMVTGFMRRRNESAERIRQLTGLLGVVKALVWITGFIVLLGNLGYDVRTFIAGLGVGGIAIALAAQTVLVDLFSYFVIFFDKPFEIGDYVTTPTASGVVEQIGIKTTRLRSLDGEQLVMSNTDLTKSTIRNYKRLEKRRSVFTLQVVYSTKTDLLKQIPTIVKDIVSSHELTTFDRAHLSSLGSSSVNYEVVYIVDSPEFGKYMDTQQSVLLKIMEAFHVRGIEFAYPTQRLYIDKPQEETEQVAKTVDMNANSGSNDGNR